MKDIHVIASDYERDSFGCLPESLDRLRSCHYFCAKIQYYATSENDQKARWYFRAALSSYQSALDTIDSDIKILIGRNDWHKSDQKQYMYDNTLIKILSKARNFAVHSARITGEMRVYNVVRIDGNGQNIVNVRSLFFDELNKQHNFKDVSNVSRDEIEWFNKQSQTWPVDLLIRQGLYEASRYVHHFCALHQIA